LSADNGVYTNVAGTTPASGGDNAAYWRDRSGNGNHASHGAAAQLPNYETGVVNGLPVLRFSAGNADRSLASGLATGNTASVWAVASWSSLLSSNPGINQAAPAVSPFSTSTSEKVVGMWISNTAGNRLWGRG